MNYDWLKINEIELLHIKKTLELIAVSNNTFNAMKKNLSPLFAILIDEGCLKINPCSGIKNKIHIKKLKELYEENELIKIRNYIKSEIPFFENYFEIFFHSGSRTPELLGVQKKDVDLEKREFTITVKKGMLYRKEKRAIVKSALPFWEKQIEWCLFEDDYLFSYHYFPGKEEMNREIVYRFWKRNFIDKEITEKTIYTLKHTFLDLLEENFYNAQFMAGHTTDKTTQNYVLGREKRQLELLKEVII